MHIPLLTVDWGLSISSTTLQTFPTFGGKALSSPSSVADTITAPITTVFPVPTAPSVYPQELPSKLVKKILDLEFVEMTELMPDSWRSEKGEYQCCSSHSHCIPKRGPVINILLWLECYSSLVAVLSSKYPNKIGQFMAYQKTIIRAHRSFIGEGWVVYDSCFRRKAANTGERWISPFTMKFLLAEPRYSNIVASASVNCTPHKNAAWS